MKMLKLESPSGHDFLINPRMIQLIQQKTDGIVQITSSIERLNSRIGSEGTLIYTESTYIEAKGTIESVEEQLRALSE